MAWPEDEVRAVIEEIVLDQRAFERLGGVWWAPPDTGMARADAIKRATFSPGRVASAGIWNELAISAWCS